MAGIISEAALFVDEAEEATTDSAEAESRPQNSPAATQALLRPKDPCSFCSHQDFIVFSEFSEVLGPLPLLTIPSHVHDDDELDMNSFILKIMSVDYQANPSGHFGIAADAQVLQTPVIQGIHAYVHYFTLYDIHARGFVRPMCLAFVTRDKRKLENQFLLLRENFLKVTEVMKLDNRRGFVEDIKHTLHCLRTTQEQYFRLRRMEEERQELSPESFKYLESIDIEQLVNYYAELKNLLHIVEPSLADNDVLDTELKDWINMVKNSDLREARRLLEKLEQHQPRLMNMSGSKRARFIRPVVCVSPWGSLATLWKLMDLQKYFARCSLSVDLNLIHTSFNPEAKPRDVQYREMKLAFDDHEFLKLMSNITDPKEWADENTPMNDNNKQEHSSSSDSNCSFHSAKPSLVSTTSSDSFRDLDKNLSDWSLNENSDSVWSDCLWSGGMYAANKPGQNLLEFFSEFSATARHLIYSILVGRTVVLAGPKQLKSKAIDVILALAPLIPGRCSSSILKWHQGILISSHLDLYKLVGLCVPERLTVHDLINSQDKNRVTVLDLASKQLLGPAYSGSLLSPIMPASVSLHQNDQSLILILHALLSEIDQKVSVCRVAGPLCLPSLGLQGCDASIVKYLAQLSKNNE